MSDFFRHDAAVVIFLQCGEEEEEGEPALNKHRQSILICTGAKNHVMRTVRNVYSYSYFCHMYVCVEHCKRKQTRQFVEGGKGSKTVFMESHKVESSYR